MDYENHSDTTVRKTNECVSGFRNHRSGQLTVKARSDFGYTNTIKAGTEFKVPLGRLLGFRFTCTVSGRLVCNGDINIYTESQ